MNEELRQAVETVIRELGAKTDLSSANAVAYAKNIDRAEREYGSAGIRSQVNYILANLQYWRGPVAKQTKGILRRYSH